MRNERDSKVTLHTPETVRVLRAVDGKDSNGDKVAGSTGSIESGAVILLGAGPETDSYGFTLVETNEEVMMPSQEFTKIPTDSSLRAEQATHLEPTPSPTVRHRSEVEIEKNPPESSAVKPKSFSLWDDPNIRLARNRTSGEASPVAGILKSQGPANVTDSSSPPLLNAGQNDTAKKKSEGGRSAQSSSVSTAAPTPAGHAGSKQNSSNTTRATGRSQIEVSRDSGPAAGQRANRPPPPPAPGASSGTNDQWLDVSKHFEDGWLEKLTRRES